MKTKKQTNEATFKSFDGIDLSKIPGSATEILTTNFERFNDCKSAQDVIALCHELFDNAKLDTVWTNKFFYQLNQIVENNPNPRKAYQQALLYVNNARMRGMGLGMKSRRFRESENDTSTLYVIKTDAEADADGGVCNYVNCWGTYDYAIACKIIDELFTEMSNDVAFSKNEISAAQKNLKQALKRKQDSQASFTTNYVDGEVVNDDYDGEEYVNSYDTTIAVYINPNSREILDDIQMVDDKNFNDTGFYLCESMDKDQKEEFKKKLREGAVKFVYKKVDGTERTANGTLDPKLMDAPEKFKDKTSDDIDKASDKQTKKRKLPADSVFYFDIDAKGFRSFKMANFVKYL